MVHTTGPKHNISVSIWIANWLQMLECGAADAYNLKRYDALYQKTEVETDSMVAQLGQRPKIERWDCYLWPAHSSDCSSRSCQRMKDDKYQFVMTLYGRYDVPFAGIIIIHHRTESCFALHDVQEHHWQFSVIVRPITKLCGIKPKGLRMKYL